MKAVQVDFESGDIEVADVPPPTLRSSGIIVQSGASMISAGTERAIISMAKMTPLGKAKTRPDLVKKVLDKAGQDGLINTVKIVRNLVKAPLPLGYSCAGIVREVGGEVSEFQPGDRVACAGLNYANHAEMVYIPRNLAVKIPDNVTYEEASFVTLGAIAMQGVRQAGVELGETVVVIGLGLVGQITAQLCLANGCRVLGVDVDKNKTKIAEDLGVQETVILSGKSGNVLDVVQASTKGRGADKIIITAGTKDSSTIKLSAEIARDRATVVAVGDIGLNVPRRAFFEKEIELKLSRSYGPGRYDPQYEENGVDYPIGYVRWTERRNMESFLDLLSDKKIDMQPLMTHRYKIEDAEDAYQALMQKEGKKMIGTVLEYDVDKKQEARVSLETVPKTRTDKQNIGVIGAGQFVQGILLPELKKQSNISFKAFASAGGMSAKSVANKYKAEYATSDYQEILSDKGIQAVLIGTRHNLHAEMVCDALKNGKDVFVEKPLAINEDELQKVIQSYTDSCETRGEAPMVMVGFNRRFAPFAQKIQQVFAAEKKMMVFRVNAGAIPKEHWTQDKNEGGGRIVGEVCHFVDLMQYVAGCPVVEVSAMGLAQDNMIADPDTLSIHLRYQDGSVGTIIYASNGSNKFPKERFEVYGGNRVGLIENWRQLHISDKKGTKTQRNILGSDKGHGAEMQAFSSCLSTRIAPIDFERLVETTRVTFAIQDALHTGHLVSLPTDIE